MRSKTTVALVILFVCAVVVAGQRRAAPVKPAAPPAAPTTPRPVLVRMKDKSVVTGTYLRADAAKVFVVVAGNEIGINLDDVAVVSFMGEPAPVNTEDALGRASKALRQLYSATGTLIGYQDYGTRLIDAKTEVDEAFRKVPDGPRKESLYAALNAFLDAKAVWELMLRYESLPASILQTWIDKYKIQVAKVDPEPLVFREIALMTIWFFARDKIDESEK